MGSSVSLVLPTGTVTLLLADVEGSTRLWETQPGEMAAAVALLDRTVSAVVAAHGGVRPVEQGEGDSFVVAFARASDAVACALELQRAPLAVIRLRIGVHTGEVQLRDEGNYVGPTVNRAARLRDLAHGGQTVLSGTTRDLVVDQLPAGVWLTDLGTHQLRDLPRPERVAQLCHPDLRNEFPPLRSSNALAVQQSSGAAHQFRRPRRGDPRRAADLGREQTRDPDRRGRRRQVADGGPDRRPDSGRVRRRGVVRRSGTHQRSRRRPGHTGARAGPVRPTRYAPRRTQSPVSSATARCLWCWTNVSICSARARRWSLPC